MKILLIGNPNVGKSALFSRLTGIDIMVSNYAGTTVEFKKGDFKLGNKIVEIIDVPGTYTLEPTCKAEEVAVEMLKEGDLVINVVDATNLERNLFLTHQLLEKNIPMIIALNFWNETKHKGIDIDVEELEKMLSVPVVPTVAITAEGIKELVSRLDEAKARCCKCTEKEKWGKIGGIVKKVQHIHEKKHTFLETVEDLSIKPLTGLPIAVMVLLLTFFLIRVVGEGLIKFIFEPLFNLYLPLLNILSNYLGEGIIHNILIGFLVDGEIHFIESMGLLTTGLFVPIGMILPYVFAFYLALGILEDIGYLPRLAALVDSIMHKLGVHGLAIIPMMLGAGCNVPGVLATRILETKRQRFIAITLTSIAIPCMAQSAMIYGLLGKYGIKGLGIVFLTLLFVWMIIGFILHKTMKGIIPETFIEISPYRIPNLKSVIKKLWIRLKGFMREALVYVLLGVLIANILFVFGVIQFFGNIAAPVIVNVFGLPKEAVASLIVGFLRKDVAVGMLLPLGLTMKQLIIASVVLTMYFPCIATFVVIFKELGWKNTIKSSLIMVFSSLLVGGLLNLIL
jgi:ferrous iron transport protein B